MMSYFFTRFFDFKRTLKSGLIVTSLVAAPLALSQEEEGSDTDGFQIGSSCAGLAYASSNSLRGLISGGYADDFHAFCFPEEPSECADYTSFLKGVGRLAVGEDGYHCSLQLQ
jgi:hypothetical protein